MITKMKVTFHQCHFLICSIGSHHCHCFPHMVLSSKSLWLFVLAVLFVIVNLAIVTCCRKASPIGGTALRTHCTRYVPGTHNTHTRTTAQHWAIVGAGVFGQEAHCQQKQNPCCDQAFNNIQVHMRPTIDTREINQENALTRNCVFLTVSSSLANHETSNKKCAPCKKATARKLEIQMLLSHFETVNNTESEESNSQTHGQNALQFQGRTCTGLCLCVSARGNNHCLLFDCKS